MHATKSLKAKIILYFLYTTKKTSKKKYFNMHVGFNNQFIKVMRTWPIFQKNQKKYFVLLTSLLRRVFLES